MTGARRPVSPREGAPGRGGEIVSRRGPGPAPALLALSLLIALTLGGSPAGRAPGAVDPLASLKTGQWIHIEGVLRPDSTARCDELRILTGDFLDDDWIIKGYIQTLDAANREFAMAGVRVQVNENTGFDSPKKTFKSYPDLRAGNLVEVEGTYLKNRKFLAVELDDESDDVAQKPWARNQLLLVGKVERADARRRLVAAMGVVFQVTDRTRIRSVIE